MALGRAARHVERELRRMLEDLVAAAGGAQPRDDAPAPAALVARHLRLREHTRENLLLDHTHAAAPAFGARVYVPVRRGARAAAVVAEDALFDDELGGAEVSTLILGLSVGRVEDARQHLHPCRCLLERPQNR